MPIVKLLSLLFLMFPAVLTLEAQTAAVTGRVSDESGAMVPAAAVTLNGPQRLLRTAAAGADGSYTFVGLQAGEYTVTASAPQLVLPRPVNITLSRAPVTVNLQLRVAATAAELTIQENAGPAVSTEASANANATVIAGDDLQSLADDPDDLQADLEALAGPAAGPGGNEIFVDGFSGGQLPPKESIREVRLNANPFAPEYDKVGLGRIEIFTKPGTDRFHGTIGYNLGTDWWNSRNPYAAQKAPFLLQETENSLSGPITKRSSFTLDLERQAVDNGSVSNGVVVDPATFAEEPFNSVLKTPQRHYLARPHIDYQLNDNNYLSVRYSLVRSNIHDQGIGAFDLISRGYTLRNNYDTAQFVETSVHGTTVNETRFQFYRWGYSTAADTPGAAIQVLGAFNGGAASSPRNFDLQRQYEFQNNTSIVHGAHVFRFGARVRYMTDSSYWQQSFNGGFTFSGAPGPELDANNQVVLDASGQPMIQQISGIEQYRRTLLFQHLGYAPAEIRSLGGGASQFNLTAGNPNTSGDRFDSGIFFGDDWRFRPNLTLNLGFRVESQTNIPDHFDPAPRIGLAWAPGATANRSGKTVIRAGFGIFYDRFQIEQTLTVMRYNGLTQQQYVLTNPDFYPNVPSTAALGVGAASQSIQELDSHFRSPYMMQSAFTVERQLPRSTTLAVTYTNGHSLHLQRLDDINAPLPGTYTGPGTGVYPYPAQGPVFLIASSGLYNRNQLSVNVNSKLNAAVSMYVTWTLARTMSNSDNGTIPANPWSDAGEYGPSAFDIRNRLVYGGAINTKWGIRLNPLVTYQSGAPFDITTGGDPYGTTVYTARPGIGADPSKPGLIQTPYGLLDPNPSPGEKILVRNSGRGPFQIMANLRVTKTWGFGSEKSAASGQSVFSTPSSRRYNVSLGMSARNLLNHDNPGPIIGNITSPLFGQANQVAGGSNGEGFSENASNRRLELQLRFVY
ncbi:MAG TPA: carboxypeptidase regulatory-like domain-containing protein [Bryobacteraceae bacterium]|nr:carboxypeptidase regulatory-like domain-containing protein [Bryobacteraceae bacterium]